MKLSINSIRKIYEIMNWKEENKIIKYMKKKNEFIKEITGFELYSPKHFHKVSNWEPMAINTVIDKLISYLEIFNTISLFDTTLSPFCNYIFRNNESCHKCDFCRDARYRSIKTTYMFYHTKIDHELIKTELLKVLKGD